MCRSWNLYLLSSNSDQQFTGGYQLQRKFSQFGILMQALLSVIEMIVRVQIGDNIF